MLTNEEVLLMADQKIRQRYPMITPECMIIMTEIFLMGATFGVDSIAADLAAQLAVKSANTP